jgi:hypothetical protein
MLSNKYFGPTICSCSDYPEVLHTRYVTRTGQVAGDICFFEFGTGAERLPMLHAHSYMCIFEGECLIAMCLHALQWSFGTLPQAKKLAF